MQLDTAARAGYQNVELIGSHLEDAAGTRAKLDVRGLKASSAHVGIAALRERFDATLAACNMIGFKQLFMPSVPPAERDSGAPYWAALGKELGQMAVRAQAQGIELGYHNHHWELQKKADGRTALEWFFEGALGTPLVWQVDVAWLVRGEADPAALMQRYKDRVVSAHAKDLAPAGEKLDEDGWADVGSGRLDWAALSAACRNAGARWLVAEHDKPNDAVRFANASFRYLNSL